MISLSQTRYGSGFRPGGARHGRSRRWRSYQESSAAGSGRRGGNGAEDRAGDRVGYMARERTDNQAGTLQGGAPQGERRPGLRAVGATASRIAAPIVGRQGGGVLARLKAEWSAVVGADLAAISWPDGLGRDGALKLRVVPGL